MSEVIGFACLATALAFFWAAWFDYSWRMVIASIVLIIVGGLCLAAPAHGQQIDAIEPDCKVQVKFTLHAYTGPIVIQDVCLSAPVVYADGLLTIETRDYLTDGIFHGDFEVLP